MKTFKNTYLVLVLLFVALTSFKNESKGDIIGKWKNAEKGLVIEIHKIEQHFYGKVISSTDDDLKPGHIFLTDIVFNDENSSYSGKVNMPSGMSASCEIKLLSTAKFQMNVTKLFITKTNTFIKIN